MLKKKEKKIKLLHFCFKFRVDLWVLPLDMVLQVCLLSETTTTQGADEWPLARVGEHVGFQPELVVKDFPTNTACIGAPPGLGPGQKWVLIRVSRHL